MTLLLGTLLLSALCANGLEILNSSPVVSSRTVVLSLNTKIEGPYTFTCERDSANVLSEYTLPVRDEEERLNVPYAVFYGNFFESETVQCTVKGANETETAITKVQVLDASEISFRVRKEVRDLTETERVNFFTAILEIKNRFVYDYMVMGHNNATSTPARNAGEEGCSGNKCTNTERNAAHSGPTFLTWHREYIQVYEDCLRMVSPGKDDVASHYWNWVRDESVGRNSKIFTADYFGAVNETQISNKESADIVDGYFVKENFPIRESEESNYLTSINRQLGTGVRSGSIPTATNLQSVVCSELVYDVSPWQARISGSFRDVIEGGTTTAGGFHNIMHGWVGGTLAPPPYASNDPIFFAHHTFIDATFHQWQLRHPDQVYLPRDEDETAPALHKASASFVPYGFNSDAVWVPEIFSYSMEDLDELVC